MNIKRVIKFLFQRAARGWDDSETWHLSGTIAEFALPRLKRFKEISIAYPSDSNLTPEDWDLILDDIIYSLEVEIDDNSSVDPTTIDWSRAQKGNMLFGQYFRDLWW